jgi:hypothetical protein
VNEHQQLAIRALEDMRGDDLARAKRAFAGMTSAQMKEQHGQSGKTRAQVIAEYVEHEATINAAIRWVEAAR